MAGVFRRCADRIGGNAAVGSRTVAVAGDGHDIILVQVVKGQGTYAAPVRFADADPRRHGHDVGMHVRCRLDRTCFQILVTGNIRTELVGHVVDGQRRAGRVGLPFGNLHRHIYHRAAGRSPRPQLIRGVAAQVPQPRRIHLARFQVFFILISFFAGNILAGHRHTAAGLQGLRAGNIAVVGILQLCVGQRPRCGNALVRTGKAQAHRRVHLSQGVLAGCQHIGKPRVRAPLDAALDIVIYLTDGCRHAGCDAGSCLVRLHPGQVHAAGHLDIAVIGAVLQVRTACIGYIICFFLIFGGCVHQQGAGAGIGLVHGQAEGHAGIRAGSMAVVGHRQAQGRSNFRTVPDGRIFNVACLGDPR